MSEQACLEELSQTDLIMEPAVLSVLQRYLAAGGSPELAVDKLCENYIAVAQTVNMLAEWLIQTGGDISAIQSHIENHFADLIMRHFDPQKADSIFTEEGKGPDWLLSMIEHQNWRKLIYRLADEYPDCLMLNFTVKMISAAGYQGEITGVATACQQLDVFTGVVKTLIQRIVKCPKDGVDASLISELSSMLAYSRHTFVYGFVVLQNLCDQQYGGSVAKRIMQEIYLKVAPSNSDIIDIVLCLGRAPSYPKAVMALSSMLVKRRLNPADMTTLHRLYSSDDPPPVELIRDLLFLDLLIRALFTNAQSINPDYKSKYAYLLAYSASAYEKWHGSMRTLLNNDDVKSTLQAIERVSLVLETHKGGSDLIGELALLFQCARFPVVSLGLLHWIEMIVLEPGFFERTTESTPVPLALLDEIVNFHPLHHHRVLSLLVELLGQSLSGLDVFARLEVNKMLIDRMIHLLSRGFALPVLEHMSLCLNQQLVDVSLIRYFVTEVLDIVEPPFSREFTTHFLPFLKNQLIVEPFKAGHLESDLIKDFLSHCEEEND